MFTKFSANIYNNIETYTNSYIVEISLRELPFPNFENIHIECQGVPYKLQGFCGF